LLGQISGTPTIRLYKPVTKQGKSNAKKIVLDYQFERKAVDMKRYVDGQMTNFVEPIRGSLAKFTEKATRNGLPQVLLFTSKAKTSSLTKYLSTEFRRRLLIAEIYPTRTNQELLKAFELTADDDLPAMLVIPVNRTEPIRYDGGDFTRRKLHHFLSSHALKEPVFPAQGGKKEPIHTEF
jgi:hypothetical protein